MAATTTSDDDKTEQATPFRLEEARRQGMVAKSPDLMSWLVLSVFLVAAFATGIWAMHSVMALAVRLLSASGQSPIGMEYSIALAHWYSVELLTLMAPLFILVSATVVAGGMLITGPVFSLKALSPDLNRLNPIQGLKRILSLRTLYETLKSVIKIVLISLTVYLTILYLLQDLMALPRVAFRQLPERLLRLGGVMMFALVIGLAMVAVVDAVYVRWDFLRKLRMSRRELRDEVRRREGDPHIRARRRDLLKIMRRRSAATARIKDASVVVVNPTHLAVALEYRRGEMPAPRIVAKGSGDLAKRIRTLAFQHRVPVVEDAPLARALFEIEIDGYVSEALFGAVAAILRRAWRFDEPGRSG